MTAKEMIEKYETHQMNGMEPKLNFNTYISVHSPPRGIVSVPSTSNRAIIRGFAGVIFAVYSSWVFREVMTFSKDF